MAFTLLNPLYPKPHIAKGTSSVATGVGLVVGSSSASSFSATAFDSDCQLIILDVQTNPVYVTFDGTTPSVAGSGHLWSAGTTTLVSYHILQRAAALNAKFLATGGSAFIYASQWSP